MAVPIITIDQFDGGILDDATTPATNGGQMFSGLDIHSENSILQVSQKLTKETDIFTDLPLWIIRNENDSNFKYWALGDTGNLYKTPDIGGTWILDSNVSGNGNGLAVYNGTKWYCTDNSLVGSVTKSIDSATYHPLKVFLGNLFGGADRYIFKVESDGTFTKRALTLPAGMKVKSVDVYGDRLVIGTFMGNSLTDKAESHLFTWDGLSEFPTESFYLQENGMNAIISWENILLNFAGIQGNVYAFNNAFLDVAKQVPDVGVATGGYVYVSPGAVAQYGSKILAGVSVGSGSALGGVWTFGRKTEDLPFAMTRSHPISTGSADVQIGAILTASANKFLVGWKDGSNYGMDLLDLGTKFSSGYMETQEYEIMTDEHPNLVKGIVAVAEPMPSGTSITVDYKLDDASSYTSGGTINSSNQSEMLKLLVRGKVAKFKFTLNASGNNSPKVKRFEIY